jgi:ABC-2 family transporter protein
MRAVQAVDAISFAISPGEVVGFLGPNGAGKTPAPGSRLASCSCWWGDAVLLLVVTDHRCVLDRAYGIPGRPVGGVYQTGRWPIGIYPDWLRYSLTFLVPIGLAITVPAEALAARLQWISVLLAAGFALVLIGLGRWFWRFELRHYSGASA